MPLMTDIGVSRDVPVKHRLTINVRGQSYQVPNSLATSGSTGHRRSPTATGVATRKLHEFVQELGACLHGMNEELSATIEN